MILPVQSPPTALQEPGSLLVRNASVAVIVDRTSGRFDLRWGENASVRSIVGEARLADGRVLRTADYARHEVQARPVRDVFGVGTRIVVRHLAPGRPELRHVLWVYASRPEVLVRLDVVGAPGSNGITPVLSEAATLPGARQSLFVPYDNDGYVRYRSDAGAGAEPSHEVGALYDDASRRSLVVGSIDHDLWKTGVRFDAGLRVLVGEADKGTRDVEPHGTATGREIRSPRIALGFYGDWRTGMERYGDLNALVRPPLPWTGSVPFGWNSWAAYKDRLTDAEATNAVDFVAALPALRDGGTAYVNLDSFWDNLKPAQLRAFAERVHAKGLKAGIYWTPFVAWGRLTDRVTGDEGRTYGDLALKGTDGKPLPKLDGGVPLDPSHPGTLARIDRELAQFVDWGFDFVKLDFLTHGALEGRHHDPKVTTGTMAFDRAMRRIADDLAPKRIGRPFFISLSIAPLFPSGFAHARRVSCDAFADIGASEYMLNSATYAWWQAGRLYAFDDPDHTVVDHPLNEKPTTEAEARTRMLASVIAGGMVLDSDDLLDPAAAERVRRLVGDPALLGVARRGVPFRPVDGDTGERAGEAFVRRDGDDLLVAAFNYDKGAARREAIPLARLGLTGTWSVQAMLGAGRVEDGAVTFDLPPTDCALVRLRRTP